MMELGPISGKLSVKVCAGSDGVDRLLIGWFSKIATSACAEITIKQPKTNVIINDPY